MISFHHHISLFIAKGQFQFHQLQDLTQEVKHATWSQVLGLPMLVLSATIQTFGGTFTTGGWKTIFDIYVLPVDLHVRSSF